MSEGGEVGRGPRPLRVFISYAHEYEGDTHGEMVRTFWAFLRSCGIEASLDLTAAGHRQDWPLWMAAQIRDSDHVLVIASPTYRKRAEGRSEPDLGRGVQWEARLIRDAYYSNQYPLDRFVPVVLPGQSVEGVPDFLAPRSSTVYYVQEFTVAGAEPLLRLLTGQPAWTEPPLGAIPVLREHDLAVAAARDDVLFPPEGAGGMLTEALTALASTAASALVSAMVTDGWEGMKARLARLFGRGDAKEAEAVADRLELSRAATVGLSGAGLQRARAEQEIMWRTRLCDLLEQDPAAEHNLRALVAEMQALIADSVGRVEQHAAAFDQAQQAVQGHGVQNITFGGQSGSDPSHR